MATVNDACTINMGNNAAEPFIEPKLRCECLCAILVPGKERQGVKIWGHGPDYQTQWSQGLAPKCTRLALGLQAQWNIPHYASVWHVADNKDVLAHCKEGTYDSGCLVCFVAACILDRNVMHIFDEYVADQVYQHHDRPDLSLSRLWHESGLWEFLNSTRKDPQTCHLLKPICVVLETMGVEVSRCKLHGCRQPNQEG